MFFSLLLSGQAYAQATIKIANAEDVGSCKHLENVEADSGGGKQLGWQGLAIQMALKKEEKLGASHIVWDRLIPVRAFNGVAVGKAYQCKF